MLMILGSAVQQVIYINLMIKAAIKFQTYILDDNIERTVWLMSVFLNLC